MILALPATLLQGTAQPEGPMRLIGSPLVMIVLMMGVFYFLLIRPAQTRQKKVAEMLRALKNGDKVITNGGIYGTIVGLDDGSVQLRIADQVKIKVMRSAIAGPQPQADQKES
jgi:preprotein translocase subunit YajC